LTRARAQAKMTACMANLHDLGIALHTYAHDHDPYFPPTPYIGSNLMVDDPQGDDNLFVLWYRKYAKNLASFSCPATRYRVRPPDRILQQQTAWGIKFVLLMGMRVRNEFEQLAQRVSNNGFGTSYEYNVWYAWTMVDGSKKRTDITWYHAAPPVVGKDAPKIVLKTLQTMHPHPSFSILMHDADTSTDKDLGDVIGANGQAHNNNPEPWDNHGTRGMDILFADNHVASLKPAQVRRTWDMQNRDDQKP
jgi:hypothetical protein